jgi:hypothetical protein
MSGKGNGAVTAQDGAYTPSQMFIRRTTLRDEVDIPSRPWLAPGHLIRGGVTLIFGPPDQGKSLLLVAWVTALISGTQWGSFRPRDRARVLTIFCEEDDDEQNARLAAARRAFGLTKTEAEPYLRRLIVINLATLLEVDAKTGAVISTDGWGDLVAEIIEFRPDVLVIDPLIEIHTAEENDNTKIKAVIGSLRSLARGHRLAVLASHHTRKGTAAPGSLEMARGASAAGGAVRIAYSVYEALDDDLGRIGIPADRRRYYVRLDRARASQAPPNTDDAEWFHKHTYTLDNGDGTPALLPWEPPPIVAPGQMELARLLADIASGYIPPGAGSAIPAPWSPQRRDHQPRSIRTLFQRHHITKAAEHSTLRAMEEAGVHIAEFRSRPRAEPRQGYRTAALLPPADWTDQEPEAAPQQAAGQQTRPQPPVGTH